MADDKIEPTLEQRTTCHRQTQEHDDYCPLRSNPG
jgi:hypothetical protein